MSEVKATTTTTSTSTKPPVPESVLKNRKTLQRRAAERKTRLQQHRKKSKQTRKIIFKRAEKYVKEYRSLERSEVRLRRIAKQGNNFYRPDEPKLAFVIRIRGINQVSPKVKKDPSTFEIKTNI